MTDNIGRILNRQFRIDQFVAKGSVGSVYRAWDLQRQAPVAIKILHADLIHDVDVVQSFRNEALTLETLAHEGIVPFYGFFHEGSLIYQVTAFIEGGTLKDQLTRNRRLYTPKECLQILTMLCPALNYAHNRGVIHCDVKPGNILISHKEKFYLTDFSIANVAWRQRSKKSGAGTPAYMAPEQIRGQAVSRQTDIYALGVVLYELLTRGHKPYDGSTAPVEGRREQIQWEHLHRSPPSLRTFQPALFESVEIVVLRCLEKAPERRFRDSMELLAAFALAAGLPNPIEVDSDVPTSQNGATKEKVSSAGQKQLPKISLPRIQPKLLWVFGVGITVLITVFAMGLAGGSGGAPANAVVISQPPLNSPAVTRPPYTPTVTAKRNTAIPNTLTPTKALLPTRPAPVARSWDVYHCMRVQPDPVNYPTNYVDECVIGITIQNDGRLQIDFRWLARLALGLEVTIHPDTGGFMVLQDDLGQRYDHQLSGGAAVETLVLVNGSVADGWYLFPAISAQASSVRFVDDDNGVQSEWINLNP